MNGGDRGPGTLGSQQRAGLYRSELLKDWCVRNEMRYAEIGVLSPRVAFLQPAKRRQSSGGAFEGVPHWRPPIGFARVKSVTAIPRQGFLCTDDGALLFRTLGFRDDDPRHDLGPACVGQNGDQTFWIDVGPDPVCVHDECIFLGGVPNFGHFAFQTLCRLAVLDWLPAETRKLPVILYDDLPARYYDFLELCGLPRNRWKLVAGTKATRFDSVWVTSSPMRTLDQRRFEFCWLPESIWKIRQSLAAHARPAGQTRPKLYLHRTGAAWRQIINRDAVTTLLQRHGFVGVRLETMSARQQIELLSNAEAIVAEGGATSAATLFAPPDCEIIELIQPILRAEFGAICFAAILGQPYTRIVGSFSGPDTGVERIMRDFEIDCAALEAALGSGASA
jgi:hypothetical protein